MSLFQGKPMIIHSGGTSRKDGQTQAASTRLFHIRQSSCRATRAVEVNCLPAHRLTLRLHLNLCLPHLIGSCTIPQVEASASNLNTNDVFVLKSSNALFVWRGVGASDEEMEAAKHVVNFLGGSPSQVSEGKEPGECPEISWLRWTFHTFNKAYSALSVVESSNEFPLQKQKQCNKQEKRYQKLMIGVFFLLPPSWFLVYPWWQKGLPNLQESTECEAATTTVWLLQQNWKTYCKPLRTHRHTQYSFHLVPKWRNLSSLLFCVSGRRSPWRLHAVWLGHWWCHAPGYLGPGKLSSLSPSLEIPNSWTPYKGRRVTNGVSLSCSSSFGSAKMLMQRKGPGLPR